MPKIYFFKKTIFFIFIFFIIFFSGSLSFKANDNNTNSDRLVFFRSEGDYDLFDRIDVKRVEGLNEISVSKAGCHVPYGSASEFRIYLKEGYTTSMSEINESQQVDLILSVKNIVGTAAPTGENTISNAGGYFRFSSLSITSDSIIEIGGIVPRNFKANFAAQNFQNAILSKQSESFDYGSTYRFSVAADVGYHFDDFSVTVNYENLNDSESVPTVKPSPLTKKYDIFNEQNFRETYEVIICDSDSVGLRDSIIITINTSINANSADTFFPPVPGTAECNIKLDSSLDGKIKVLKDGINVYTNQNNYSFLMAQNETVNLEISTQEGFAIKNLVDNMFVFTDNITTVADSMTNEGYSYLCTINGCANNLDLNFNSNLQIERIKVYVGLNFPNEVDIFPIGSDTTKNGNTFYVSYGKNFEFSASIAGSDEYTFKLMMFGSPNIVKKIEKDGNDIYSYGPITNSNIVIFAEKISNKKQIQFELDNNSNESGLLPSIQEIVNEQMSNIDILGTTVDLPSSGDSFKFAVILKENFNKSNFSVKRSTYDSINSVWIENSSPLSSYNQNEIGGHSYYFYALAPSSEDTKIVIEGIKTNEYEFTVSTNPMSDLDEYIEFYKDGGKLTQISDFSEVKIKHGEDYSFWVDLKSTSSASLMSLKHISVDTISDTEIEILDEDRTNNKVKITLKNVQMDMNFTNEIVISRISRREYNVQFCEYGTNNLDYSKMEIIEKFPGSNDISLGLSGNKTQVSDGNYIEFKYKMSEGYTKCEDNIEFTTTRDAVNEKLEKLYSSTYGENTIRYYPSKDENQKIIVNGLAVNKYSAEIKSDSIYRNKVAIITNGISLPSDLSSPVYIYDNIYHPNTNGNQLSLFEFSIVTLDKNYKLNKETVKQALDGLCDSLYVSSVTLNSNGTQMMNIALNGIRQDLTDDFAITINNIYRDLYNVNFSNVLATNEAVKIEKIKITSSQDLNSLNFDDLENTDVIVESIVDNFLNAKEEDKNVAHEEYFCFRIIPKYGYDQQLFNNLEIQILMPDGNYKNIELANQETGLYHSEISLGKVEDISSEKYGVYCCVKNVRNDLEFNLLNLQKNKYNIHFAGDFAKKINNNNVIKIRTEHDGIQTVIVDDIEYKADPQDPSKPWLNGDGLPEVHEPYVREIGACQEPAEDNFSSTSCGIIANYYQEIRFKVIIDPGYDKNEIKITAEQEDSTSNNILVDVDLIKISERKVETGDQKGQIIMEFKSQPIMGKNIITAQLRSAMETVRLTSHEGATYYRVEKNDEGFYTNETNTVTDEVISGDWSIELDMNYKFAVKANDAYDINTLKAYTNGEEDINELSVSGKTGIAPVPVPNINNVQYLIFTIPSIKHQQVVKLKISKKKLKVYVPNQSFDENGNPDGVAFFENNKEIKRSPEGTDPPKGIDVEYGSFFTFEVKLDSKHNQSNLDIFLSTALNLNKDEQIQIYPLDGNYSIGDITSDIYINFYELKINRYNIKFNETPGIAYVDRSTSDGWVYHGDSFSFGIEATQGYEITDDTALIIKNGDGSRNELFTDEQSGKYLIKNITDDKVVTAEKVGNVYFNINLKPAEGVTYKNDVGQTIVKNTQTRYNSPFEFAISLAPEYDESVAVVKVRSNQNPDVQYSTLAIGRYIIPDIKSDLEIEISNVRKNEYSVYLTPVTGIEYRNYDGKIISASQTVIHKETFTFKVTLLEEYKNSSIKVMMGLVELTADKDGFYKIEDIVESKSITVGGIEETKRSELINIINKLPNTLSDYGDVEEVIAATKKLYELPLNERNLPNIDKLSALQQQAKKWHHDTENIKIENLQWYIKLVVVPITSNMEVCGRIYDKLSKEFILSLYDVSLWDTLNNRAYKLSEDNYVRVTIPTPDMTYFERPIGIHETQDKKIVYMTLNINGASTSFSVNSFGPMGIIANRTADNGRSSLLDAFDANVKNINDYADYIVNTNSNKDTSSTDSEYNNLPNNEEEKESENKESEVKESGKFSEITPTGSFMRLLLLIIIAIIVVVCALMFIKNRDEVNKNKEKTNSKK